MGVLPATLKIARVRNPLKSISVRLWYMEAIASLRKAHILLIGMMGAGKTTIGQILADQLKRPYIDSDRQVMQATGKSVAEIFKEEGEAAFRRQERIALQEAVKVFPPAIISVAGGAVLDESNRRILEQAGKVVFLRASLDTLADRLGTGEGRPLLNAGGTENDDGSQHRLASPGFSFFRVGNRQLHNGSVKSGQSVVDRPTVMSQSTGVDHYAGHPGPCPVYFFHQIAFVLRLKVLKIKAQRFRFFPGSGDVIVQSRRSVNVWLSLAEQRQIGAGKQQNNWFFHESAALLPNGSTYKAHKLIPIKPYYAILKQMYPKSRRQPYILWFL